MSQELLEQEIFSLQERNRRVEAAKAWEKSMTRRAFIAFVTYLTASVFLWLMDAPLPFLNSLVPTGGYVLSTLSLPWLKVRWIRKNRAGLRQNIE